MIERKRRILLLVAGGAAIVAVLLVLGSVYASRNESSSESAPDAPRFFAKSAPKINAAHARQLYAGVPQNGMPLVIRTRR